MWTRCRISIVLLKTSLYCCGFGDTVVLIYVDWYLFQVDPYAIQVGQPYCYLSEECDVTWGYDDDDEDDDETYCSHGKASIVNLPPLEVEFISWVWVRG